MLETALIVTGILAVTLVGYAWVWRHYSRVTVTLNHRGRRCYIVLPRKEDLEDALRSLPPPWNTVKDTIVVSTGGPLLAPPPAKEAST